MSKRNGKFQETRGKIRKSMGAIVVLIFLIPCLASAATFHVSPNGNDSNPGTEAYPWRTIQKCANTINGGDTCIVGDGIYQENVTISRSGSPGNPIRFQAGKRHQALVFGIIKNTGNHVRVEGFKVIMQDGSQEGISSSGDYTQLIDNYITTDSTSLGLNNTALGIGGNYNLVEGNFVEKTCFGYGLSGSYHVFQNNEATMLKMNGSCGDVDYMRFFGRGHVIKNNSFHGVHMSEVGSAHVDCFQSYDNNGVQYAINDVIIDGNLCENASQGIMVEGKYYGRSDGLIVRNNVFKNCSAWGICAHKIKNLIVYNNTFDMTGGIHGMGCREESSCEVKNNIFFNGRSMYWFEKSEIIDGTSQAPGKNNLLFQSGTTITGFGDDIKNKDPLFIDRKLNNYKTGPNSPARDAGIAILKWTNAVDKNGIPRPQGSGWDIGAYEHKDLSKPLNLRVFE